MNLLCIAPFFESVITGVIANIVFTILLIWVYQQFRYWYNLKRKFHNKIFEVSYKRYPDEIVQTVICKVKGNKIKFFGNRVDDKDEFSGEFILNPINLKMGEGFYSHSISDGFGFPKIIIKDENTFFVEASYIGIEENKYKNKAGFIIYQAFIWKKK